MREVEFKGKRIDNGEWVYGFYREVYMNYDYSHKCSEITYYDKYDNIWIFEVIPSTVGQFTCIYDKKQVEIYGWDILKDDKNRLWVVVEVRGGFVLQRKEEFDKRCGKEAFDEVLVSSIYEIIRTDISDLQNKWWISESCEVIGNIHDEEAKLC